MTDQRLAMHYDRRKNVSLAINAIIRGLELDHIAFRYDESASDEGPRLLGPGGIEPDEGERAVWSYVEA
jgi:hypothetical protein